MQHAFEPASGDRVEMNLAVGFGNISSAGFEPAAGLGWLNSGIDGGSI